MAFVVGGLMERLLKICGEGLPLKWDVSPEGGALVLLQNKTGGASVKGTMVEAYDDTAIDNAFNVNDIDGNHCFGVVYEAGIADGSDCWVCYSGRCQVLIEDGTAATRGYWCKSGETTAGRCDITNAAPTGGAVAALDEHMRENGHCIESVGSGTGVLAYIMCHFL